MFNKIVFLFICKARRWLYRHLSTNKSTGGIKSVQPVQLVGEGKILVEKSVTIGYFPSPHFFSSYCYLEARSKDAKISIGEGTHINNGFVAIAEQSSISIGCNCLIGTRVEIYDSDFHALNFIDRVNNLGHRAESVSIGNNVFIGSNVRILKGVSIGDNAVIGNGSIVTKNVPKNVIASGVPAKVLKDC